MNTSALDATTSIVPAFLSVTVKVINVTGISKCELRSGYVVLDLLWYKVDQSSA